MLGNKMNFSSCVIWTGFHKSSHICCFIGLPIPIVAVSFGLSYDKYGIENDNGDTIS